MKKPPPESDQYSERETARRRDETIRRMIKMAPKTHSEESASGKVTTGRPRGRPKGT